MPLIAVFLFAFSLFFIATSKPAYAALPCQSEYNAVAKAHQAKKGEAAAEQKLVKCVKDKTARPFCKKEVPNVYTSSAQRNNAIESCANWFISKFKNPPNSANAPIGLKSEAQKKGQALRGEYRAAATSPSSGSGSSSGGSSSGSGSGSGSGSADTASGSATGTTGSETVDSSDVPERPTIPTRTVQDPAMECAKAGADKKKCDLVVKYLNPMIAFFSAFVGIAVVIGIISGGIIYASAGDDPQKTAKGRTQVRNAIIALVAYIFLYALIKWLIPQTA